MHADKKDCGVSAVFSIKRCKLLPYVTLWGNPSTESASTVQSRLHLDDCHFFTQLASAFDFGHCWDSARTNMFRRPLFMRLLAVRGLTDVVHCGMPFSEVYSAGTRNVVPGIDESDGTATRTPRRGRRHVCRLCTCRCRTNLLSDYSASICVVYLDSLSSPNVNYLAITIIYSDCPRRSPKTRA